MRSRLALVTLLPLGFAPHAGWHGWASTIRWRGCAEWLTIEALPPDGIALQVAFSVEHPAVAGPIARWPPTIRPRDVGGGFEGVPGRYGVYQLAARFARWWHPPRSPERPRSFPARPAIMRP